MKETSEIQVLGNKVRLLQPEGGFRTAVDSVLLAAACPAKKDERVLDMGAGVGSASFCLLWRVECHVTGVEIQQSHVDLANENIVLNAKEESAEFVCADIAEYKGKAFDHVICNPPYLEAGSYTPSPSEERATAMGHIELNIKDWIDAGFRNLKSTGSITMIHRADMADKIIAALGKRFGAVEIIPLYSKTGQSANRVIIRALKDRKTPAKLHAGLILHKDGGGYSPSADAILRNGAAIA